MILNYFPFFKGGDKGGLEIFFSKQVFCSSPIAAYNYSPSKVLNIVPNVFFMCSFSLSRMLCQNVGYLFQKFSCILNVVPNRIYGGNNEITFAPNFGEGKHQQ